MVGGPEAALLRTIEELLAGGLETRTEPIPATDREWDEILIELRQVVEGTEQLKLKLVIGGFLNHPVGEDQQCCMNCMYFLTHRKWCDLPELSLPVKAGWWCRLWRI
jgi:hypothetical protein